MPHLVFLGTLLANPAAAAEGPTVAVVGMHEADLDAKAQADATARIVDELDGTDTVTPLTTAEFARAIAGREGIIVEETLLAKGRDLLATGKSSYNNALDEEALFNLEAAVEALSAGVAGSNTTRDLWEAWIYLAATQLNLGQDDAAAQSFEQAAALDPDRALDEAFWAPNVVTQHKGAIERLSTLGATIEIEVQGEPTVWLDGVEQGKGSLTLEGVLPGQHHLVARGEDEQAYEALTVPAVEGGAALSVKLQLGPPSLTTSGESSSMRSSETAELYRTIGRHTQGVDLILLTGTDDSNLMLQLYDVRSESFSKSLELPVASRPIDQAVENVGTLMGRLDEQGALPVAQRDPKAVALDVGSNQLLAQMLLQPALTTSAVTPIGGPPVATTRRKGTVWAIVGASVGVAALTAGGILVGTGALSPNDSGSTYDGTIVVGPF